MNHKKTMIAAALIAVGVGTASAATLPLDSSAPMSRPLLQDAVLGNVCGIHPEIDLLAATTTDASLLQINKLDDQHSSSTHLTESVTAVPEPSVPFLGGLGLLGLLGLLRRRKF